MERYAFRPFTRADLAMAYRWLATPEVSRWWGDREEQFAMLAADLDEPLMRQWIVEHFGRPIAYIQAYPARAWPQSHLAHLPATAEAIDVFIGDSLLIGQGHGGAFLRAFAEKLIAEGATLVVTDPHFDNHRARRAYTRAGFVEEGVVETEDGPIAVMLFGSATFVSSQ